MFSPSGKTPVLCKNTFSYDCLNICTGCDEICTGLFFLVFFLLSSFFLKKFSESILWVNIILKFPLDISSENRKMPPNRDIGQRSFTFDLLTLGMYFYFTIETFISITFRCRIRHKGGLALA